jgi:hypothetical protein
MTRGETMGGEMTGEKTRIESSMPSQAPFALPEIAELFWYLVPAHPVRT